MSTNVVMGSKESVLNYYLNNQFSTVPKLIITSENFFSNCSGGNQKSVEKQIQDFFESENPKEISSLFQEIQISDEFYKSLQEEIKSIGKEIDVALKNYNFMSSISNTRYNVILRSNDTSFSKYFVEKGSILASMKQLLQEYVTSDINMKQWNQFQFEIIEAEEIYKSVFVKKEQNQLLVYANFGCPGPLKPNVVGGGEIYHSIDEVFYFYKNKQEFAYLRQHGVLEKLELNKQERVLTSSELKTINEATRQIDNVILELYLTKKGTVKIIDVSSNANQLGIASKLGFVIYKSTLQYDKISLITLKDCGELETTNPQYLLIKNDLELQEFLQKARELPIDGVVITYNSYHPLLESIGEEKNIDVLYYDEPLQRSLEVTISWDDFSIEGATSKSSQNPFSSILTSENKEKDALLERLKNIDLSSNKKDESQIEEYQQIEQLTQSMTSSPNSSQSKMDSNSMYSKTPSSQSGEKKSAIGMLAEAALNKREEPKPSSHGQNTSQETPQFEQNPSQQYQNSFQQSQTAQSTQPTSQNSTPQEFSNSQGFGDFFQGQPPQQENSNLTHNTGNQINPEQVPSSSQDFFEQTIQQSDNNTNDFSNQFTNSQTTQNSQNQATPSQKDFSYQKSNNYSPKKSIESYTHILASKIYTPAQVQSSGHIVDSQSLSEVQDDGDIVLVVTDKEEITNPTLTYAMPISSGVHQQALMLISSPYDYFLAKKQDESQEPLLNISVIDSEVKLSMLEQMAIENSSLSVIITKEDISLLEPYINKLNIIYVKDALQENDLREVEYILLAFEKRFLMNQFS